MNFGVESFGALKEVDIKIKPLTLIVGKNSSGKTHLLQLLYSFNRRLRTGDVIDFLNPELISTIFKESSFSIEDESMVDYIDELKADINSQKKIIKFDRSASLAVSTIFQKFVIKAVQANFNPYSNKILQLLFQPEIIESTADEMSELDKEEMRNENETEEEKIRVLNGLTDEIASTYGVSHTELTDDKTKITLSNHIGTHEIQYDSQRENFKKSYRYFDDEKPVSLKFYYKDDIPQIESIQLDDQSLTNDKRITEFIRNFNNTLLEIGTFDDSHSIIAHALVIVAHNVLIANRRKGLEPCNSYFLASSRAGVLLSHRSLAASLLKLSRHTGRDRMVFPTLPGAHIDFLIEFIELSNYTNRQVKRSNKKTNNPFYDKLDELVRFMENKILRGKFVVKETSNYPEIKFVQNDQEFELHAVASMLSELSPLYFLIKLFPLEEGDYIFFEEPEAHLHPGIISLLSRLIVRMINTGLNLVVTTHSDFLLNEIQNLVRLNSLNLENLSLDYTKADQLDPKDVALTNLFLEGEGAVSNEIEIDNQGFKEDIFNEAIDELYDNTIQIDHAIQDKK